MIDFEKDICPVCQKPFSDPTDIACCPECGTAHHKQCWHDNGGCCFEKQHGKQMQAEQSYNDSSGQQDNGKMCFCPRCGSKIQADMMFCGKCGLDLSKAAINYKDAAGINNSPQPTQFVYAQPPIHQVDKTYTTGTDAVKPEDEIDGVRADEMAIYIGNNGGKYVKRFFKSEKNNKKVSFKWQAFLFPQCWTAYRKMLIPFIVSMLVLAIAVIPLVISFSDFTEVYFSDMSLQMGDSQTLLDYTDILDGTFIPSDELMLQAANVMLSSLILIVGQLLNGLYFGLFGEHLYKKQVIQQIKKIRQRFNQPSLDNNEYRVTLARKGGINSFYAFGVVILIYAVYIIGYYAIVSLSL